jgi:hypothetical protein
MTMNLRGLLTTKRLTHPLQFCELINPKYAYLGGKNRPPEDVTIVAGSIKNGSGSDNMTNVILINTEEWPGQLHMSELQLSTAAVIVNANARNGVHVEDLEEASIRARKAKPKG